MRLPYTYVYTILYLTLHPPQNVGTLRKVTHVYNQIIIIISVQWQCLRVVVPCCIADALSVLVGAEPK